MKLTTLLICCCALAAAYAQKTDVSLFYGRNDFFNYRGDYNYYKKIHTHGKAVALKWARVGNGNWKIHPRFELGLDYYEGGFYYVAASLGPSSSSGTFNVTTFTFACYPINVTFLKNFEWNFGLQTSFFNINQNSKIIHTGISNNTFSHTIFEGRSVSAILRVGAVTRLAYSIPLKNGWSIQPQVNYYYALTGERRFFGSIKSRRIYGGVGFCRDLGAKK